MVVQNLGGTVCEYVIMHKDIALAVIGILDVVRVIDVKVICTEDELNHFPLFSINSKNTAWNIEQWLYERSIPCKRISPVATKVDALELLLENYGLSLVDHYWIKPVEDTTSTWDSVNLYDNSFDSSIVVSKSGRSGSLNPSFSVGGELKKMWTIDENGRRVLLKWNASDNSRQSVSEVFASLMHNKQGTHGYVDYKLVKHKNTWICKCETFTDKNTEFISAYDAMDAACKKNHESYYTKFVQSCVKNGINEATVVEFLDYQILTDFVMANVDRHFNNFGVMRDSDKLQWLGIAKIFDTGNSMFAGKTVIPNGARLLDIETNSFKATEMKLLEYVMNPMVIDLGNLPTEEEFKEMYSISDTKEIVDAMYIAYKTKIRILSDLQAGIKVYEYGYVIGSGNKSADCNKCGAKLLSTGTCSNFDCK